MNLKIEESESEMNSKISKKLTEMKEDEKEGLSPKSELPNNYEKIIQKLEADVRNHISVSYSKGFNQVGGAATETLCGELSAEAGR